MTDSPETYRAFGLRIASDIALPELPDDDPGRADVTVAEGDVPESGADIGGQIGPFSFARKGALWLEVPDVARFLVTDGCEIRYSKVPGIDEDSLRVFLLGTCFGALLLQRGALVLHGNAFVIDEQCAVCVGPSGAGKSTLAARMLQRGCGVVADDVVPLDEAGRAIPGLPRIKLWQDTADALGINTTGLRRIRPGLAKYDLPLRDAFQASPTPVRAIYVLGPWNRAEFALQELKGVAKFEALHANGYRPRFMKGMDLAAEQLQQSSALAARVSVIEVRRPRLGFDVDGLADRIVADFTQRIAMP